MTTAATDGSWQQDPSLVFLASSQSLLCQRTDELIGTLKPSQESVERRYGVQEYVRQIIARCFRPEQVNAYMFGSVPLRTYLPDGDIDLSVFCSQDVAQSMRDTWALRLQSVIEQEQRNNRNPPYKIGDITVINAEVKLLKCLVDNIVVDISFNQMGGLITLNFLEEINNLIGNSNIFKRSIILVKAWCYYESRLLGAHHGLISTYALETLVLYVFNKYHASIDSPLSVLYNFLVEFSRFDWENYCLSLLGPVPLKDLTRSAQVDAALAPQNTLLQCDSRLAESLARFTAEMTSSKADSGGRGFIVRCLNIMDPLLPTNNLGRSVVRSSFARIRRAFGHGAALVRCMSLKGEEQAIQDLNNFFRNTWSALHKHDHLLSRQVVQDQQRLPEPMMLLLQQIDSAHELPISLQRQAQRQHVTSEGQNGQQSAVAAQLQGLKQHDVHAGGFANNVELCPTATQPGTVQQQQLWQQQLQQLHPSYLLLQLSLRQMLDEAAALSGMTLDTLVQSSMERQAEVLLKYLYLPQGSAAAAAVQRLQRHTQIPTSQQQQQGGQKQNGDLQPDKEQVLEPSAQPLQQGQEAAAGAHGDLQQQQKQEPDTLDVVTGKNTTSTTQHAEQLMEDMSEKAASAGRIEATAGETSGSTQEQHQGAASAEVATAVVQQQQQQEGPDAAPPASQAVQVPEPAPADADAGADAISDAVADAGADAVASGSPRNTPESALLAPETQQQSRSQQFNALDVAAAAAAASQPAAAVLHQDDAFEAEVLSVGGSAVDFTAVKAVVLAAEGVNSTRHGLMGHGYVPSQPQVQPTPQQHPQHHLHVLQQLLSTAGQMQAQNVAFPGTLSMQQLQQFMQRPASVPPLPLPVEDRDASVSAAAAAAASAATAALRQQPPRSERVVLERSASTGNLGSGNTLGSNGSQQALQLATSALLGQASVLPLSVLASGVLPDAKHGMAGALSQQVDHLQQQQQQAALLLQQQALLQQQQQVDEANDVLNGDFDQLTHNLQMAKSYMCGKPPPTPPPAGQAVNTTGHNQQHQSHKQRQQHHILPAPAVGYVMPHKLSSAASDGGLQQSPVNQHMRTLVQMGAASPVPLPTGVWVGGLEGGEAAAAAAAVAAAAGLRGVDAASVGQGMNNQQLLQAVLAHQQQQSLLHVLQHQQPQHPDKQQQPQQVLVHPQATVQKASAVVAEQSAVEHPQDGVSSTVAAAAAEPLGDNVASKTGSTAEVVPQPSQTEHDAVNVALPSPQQPSEVSAASKYTPPHRRSPAAGSLGSSSRPDGPEGKQQHQDGLLLSPRQQPLDGQGMRRSSGALARAVAAALGQEDAVGQTGSGPAAEGQTGASSAAAPVDLGDDAPRQAMAPIRTAPSGGRAGSEAAADDGQEPDVEGEQPGGEDGEAAGSVLSTGGTLAGPGMLAQATPKTPLSAAAVPFVSQRAAPSGAGATQPGVAGTHTSATSAGSAQAAEGVAGAPSRAHQGLRGVVPNHLAEVDQGSLSDYASAESTHYESTPGTPVVAGSTHGSSGSMPFTGSQVGDAGSRDSLADAAGEQLQPLCQGADEPAAAQTAGQPAVAPGSQQHGVLVVAEQHLSVVAAGSDAAVIVTSADSRQQPVLQPPPPPPRPDGHAVQQQNSSQRLMQQQQQQHMTQLHQLGQFQQLQQGLLLQLPSRPGMVPRPFVQQSNKKAKLSSGGPPQGFMTQPLPGMSEGDRGGVLGRQGSGSMAAQAAAAGQVYPWQYYQHVQPPQHRQQPSSAPVGPPNSTSSSSSSSRKHMQPLSVAIASVGSGSLEAALSLETAGSSGARELGALSTPAAAGVPTTNPPLMQQQQQQWRRTAGGGMVVGSGPGDGPPVSSSTSLPGQASVPVVVNASSGAVMGSGAGAAAAAAPLMQQQHLQPPAPRAPLQPQLPPQPQQPPVTADGFISSSAGGVPGEVPDPPLQTQATYPPALSQATSRALEMQQSLPLSPHRTSSGLSAQQAASGLQRSATEPRNSLQIPAVMPLQLPQPFIPGHPGAAGVAPHMLSPAALQHAMQFAAALQMMQPDMAGYMAAAAAAMGHPGAAGQPPPMPWLDPAMGAAHAPPQQQQPNSTQRPATKQQQQQAHQQQPRPPVGGGPGAPVMERRSSSGGPSNGSATPTPFLPPQPPAASSSSGGAAGAVQGAAQPSYGLPALQPSASAAMSAALSQLAPPFPAAFGIAPMGFPVHWGMLPIAAGPHGYPAAPPPHVVQPGTNATAMAPAATSSSTAAGHRPGPLRGATSVSSSSGGGSSNTYAAHGDHVPESQQQHQHASQSFRGSRTNSAGSSHGWDPTMQQQQNSSRHTSGEQHPSQQQMQQSLLPSQQQHSFSRFQREQQLREQQLSREPYQQYQQHGYQGLRSAGGSAGALQRDDERRANHDAVDAGAPDAQMDQIHAHQPQQQQQHGHHFDGPHQPAAPSHPGSPTKLLAQTGSGAFLNTVPGVPLPPPVPADAAPPGFPPVAPPDPSLQQQHWHGEHQGHGRVQRNQQLEQISRMRSNSASSSGGAGGPYSVARHPPPLPPQQQPTHHSRESWGSDEAFNAVVPAGWGQLQQPGPPGDPRRGSRLGQSPHHHQHTPSSQGRSGDYMSPETDSGRSYGPGAHLPPPAMHQLGDVSSADVTAGGTGAATRPRLPVGAVANLVQQAADDRERQSKSQRERSTRTAAVAAAITARAAAAAAAASTTAGHHPVPQPTRSGSTGEFADSQSPADHRTTQLAAAAGEPVSGFGGAEDINPHSGPPSTGGLSAGGAAGWEEPADLQQQQVPSGGSQGRPGSGAPAPVLAFGQGYSSGRSGSSGPSTPAAPPAAAAGGSEVPPAFAAAAGSSSADRRRSRTSGAAMSIASSRLFDQALHRAVEDHQSGPNPRAAPAAGSSASSVSAAGRVPAAPGTRAQGHDAGSACTSGGSSSSSLRALPSRQAAEAGDDAEATGGPGGRHRAVRAALIKRVVREDVPADAQQPQQVVVAHTADSSSGSTSRIRKQLLVVNAASRTSRRVDAAADAPPVTGDVTASGSGKAQQQLPDSPNSPPLDDADMFPSLPSTGHAGRASSHQRGQQTWVQQRSGVMGTSTSGPPSTASGPNSRRASADGGAAAAAGGRGSSILQQAAARAADSRGSSNQGRQGPVREGRVSSSSALSRGGSRGGSRGQSPTSLRGQAADTPHSGSKRTLQEFQLAEEDFPTLSAAGSSKGSTSSLRRDSSSGRLSQSGGGRVSSNQGVTTAHSGSDAGVPLGPGTGATRVPHSKGSSRGGR